MSAEQGFYKVYNELLKGDRSIFELVTLTELSTDTIQASVTRLHHYGFAHITTGFRSKARGTLQDLEKRVPRGPARSNIVRYLRTMANQEQHGVARAPRSWVRFEASLIDSVANAAIAAMIDEGELIEVEDEFHDPKLELIAAMIPEEQVASPLSLEEPQTMTQTHAASLGRNAVVIPQLSVCDRFEVTFNGKPPIFADLNTDDRIEAIKLILTLHAQKVMSLRALSKSLYTNDSTLRSFLNQGAKEKLTHAVLISQPYDPDNTVATYLSAPDTTAPFYALDYGGITYITRTIAPGTPSPVHGTWGKPDLGALLPKIAFQHITEKRLHNAKSEQVIADVTATHDEHPTLDVVGLCKVSPYTYNVIRQVFVQKGWVVPAKRKAAPEPATPPLFTEQANADETDEDDPLPYQNPVPVLKSDTPVQDRMDGVLVAIAKMDLDDLLHVQGVLTGLIESVSKEEEDRQALREIYARMEADRLTIAHLSKKLEDAEKARLAKIKIGG